MITRDQEFEYLTVREYAVRFDIPEQTVRSRIEAGKIKTVFEERAGRTVKVIPVRIHNEPEEIQIESQNEPVTSQNDRYFEMIHDLTNRLIEAESTAKLLPHYQEMEKKAYAQLEALYHEEKAARIAAEERLKRPWWKFWQ